MCDTAMNDNVRATSTGKLIHLVTRRSTGDRVFVVERPDGPKDKRFMELGRIDEGHFQPIMDAAYALSPEALRLIASLIDEETSGGTP